MADKTSASVNEVLRQAAAEVRRLQAAYAELHGARHEPIAVIGVACRFPGHSNTPEAFWDLIAAGKEADRDPTSRWRTVGLGMPQGRVQHASLIDDEEVFEFDAEFFGIHAGEAELMDPQQRVLLKVAWEAFERAGLPVEHLPKKSTGVFLGASYHDHQLNMVSAREHASVYSLTGNWNAFIAGRLSYLLGVQGPSFVVDTACSSALVAVHLACQSLRNLECEVALAGSSNLILSPRMMEMTEQTQALSTDGRCKTFDARANGFLRGEGCAAVVLKRLKDAQRDHDSIDAVIRGSAINQDGASAGMTAPNPTAQTTLLERALADAGLSGEDLSFVEAHGTGTRLGDPIEVGALLEVFGGRRSKVGTLFLGSVKTNVGHLESSAGAAGLLKVVAALQHEVIPPHLHLQVVNPLIHLEGTGLEICRSGRQWRRGSVPRRAGISAFGMSGTNSHVIVEEAPPPPELAPADDRPHLLPLSARSTRSLEGLARRYAQFLTSTAEPVADIAYSAGVRRNHHPIRIAVVGRDRNDWLEGLRAYVDGRQDHRLWMASHASPASGTRPVFVFSGQGSQWAQMGLALLREEATFRTAMQSCDESVMACAGFSILSMLSDTDLSHQPIDVLQPLIFSVQVGLARQWQAWGVEPAAVVGHSLGEVAAAHISGALTLRDAVHVVCARSRLMRQVGGRGGMLAVELSPARLEPYLDRWRGRVWLAVHNGAQSLGVSGDIEAIKALFDVLEADGVFCAFVKTDVAFHSPHMDALCAPLRQELADVKAGPSAMEMWSSVTAEKVHGEELRNDYWVRNLREPVMFAGAIDGAVRDGHTCFVEVSPHPVLLAPMQAHLSRSEPSKPVVVTGSLRRGEGDRAGLLRSLARLYVGGLSVAFERQHEGPRRALLLPTYAWDNKLFRMRLDGEQAETQASREARVHPHLGRSFSVSSAPEARFWNVRLMGQASDYLLDHCLGEAAVLPAALYIELMLAASRDRFPDRAVRLKDVEFLHMVRLEEVERSPLQLCMEGTLSNGAVRVSLHQALADGWDCVARGLLAQASPLAGGQHVSLNEPSAPWVVAEAMYSRLAEAGLRYGPRFRGVERAKWLRGAGLAQAKIGAPEGQFLVHPAVLDAAMHVAAAMGSGESDGSARRVYVPSAMQEVQLSSDASSAQWFQTSVGAVGIGGESFDIDLIAGDGLVVGRIKGLRLAPVPLPLASASGASAYLEHTWRSEAHLDAPGPAAGQWLVLGGDAKGFGAAVSRKLQERGGSVTQISYGPHAFDALEAELTRTPSFRGIVYMWSMTAPTLEEGPFAQVQECVCDGVLRVVQWLGRQALRTPPRLWLVTEGACYVDGDAGELNVEQALLWGMGRTLTYEHPELRASRVDVRAEPTSPFMEGLAVALADEVTHDGPVGEVALRQRGRFVGRLQRARPVAQWDTTPVVGGAAYLLVGGTGGLGLALAEWLAAQGAGTVVLASRRGAESASQQEAIEALMAAHHTVVHVVACDTSDRGCVDTLVSRFGREWPKLRGVVHAAGVLDDGFILQQTPERYAKVLTPKVVGAWNMHQAVAGHDLDFFLLYSSIAALLGSPGQSNYAAGNAFLDALAVLRKRHGQAALSINWGPFESVGMAAARRGTNAQLAHRGMAPMSVAEGNEIVSHLLRSSVAGVGAVHFDVQQWLSIYPHVAGDSLFVELATHERARPRARSDRASWLPGLKACGAEDRAARLETLLAGSVAAALRIDTKSIARNTTFSALGVDSLVSLELRNALEDALEVRLPATLTLVYPSIASLAKFLLDELGLAEKAAAGQGQVVVSQDGANVEEMSQEQIVGFVKNLLSESQPEGLVRADEE